MNGAAAPAPAAGASGVTVAGAAPGAGTNSGPTCPLLPYKKNAIVDATILIILVVDGWFALSWCGFDFVG